MNNSRLPGKGIRGCSTRNSFAGRCFRWGMIGLLALCPTSCKNREKDAGLQTAEERIRLQAAEEVRLNGAEESRLDAEEQTRLGAGEGANGSAGEEARRNKEREEMRGKIRKAAVGTKIDVLETPDGKSYSKVEIREVSAIGISIRHDSGMARVPFENLPKAMQQRFLYDPDEKRKALATERRFISDNTRKLTAVRPNQGNSATGGVDKRDEGRKRRAELQASLMVASARVRQIEGELAGIQSELRQDLRRTNRDSYRRDRGVSRAPIIRERLGAKQNQLAAARQKEAALRAALVR